MNRDKLREFIAAHIDHMSIKDMIEETGVHRWIVTMELKEMGLKALSPADVKKKFILENKDKMTVDRMIKVLETDRGYFLTLMYELELTEDDFKQPADSVLASTPREILSDYQFGNHHYRPDAPADFDPSKIISL
jgi:hypothetical protein